MQRGNLQILVVEDDPQYAKLLADALQDASSLAVTVITAARIGEAIERLRAHSYDAILTDLNLPDSQGLETFVRLSEVASNRPIIILTAMDSDAIATAALGAGADEYLFKQVTDPAQLATTIRHAIDRHAYREALRAIDLRYRSLVERSAQAILIHANGIVKFANHALAKLVGFDGPAAHMAGRTIWPYIAPEDRAIIEQFARARAGGRPAPPRYDLRMMRKDGSVRWAEAVVSVIAWEGEPAIMAALVDVTERKLAEEHLRASEERFRLLADNIKEAFIIIEMPGRRSLYVSRMWEEIWGRPTDEAHANPALWFEAIDEEDRGTLEAMFDGLRAGDPATSAFRVRRLDGSVRWVRARLFPVHDDRHVVYRVVGLVEDITDLRRTEEQLHQASRMEAVGRLAGGIAHDFNNLLTVIDGYAELVAQELRASHPSRQDIDEIRAAAQSAANLTRQLLAFSRRQVLEPRILDLNQVLHHVERLLGRVIGEDVALVMELSSPLERVYADPGQIEQIIMNLAVNARDAMPNGGQLAISTANVNLDAAFVAQHRGSSAGRYVMIAVSDTGTGMDEATQKRLFEPFFTTKPAGRGTGLGLATVYGIVKQSHGSIWVYSEPGKGSTFKIYLPAATGVAAPHMSPPVATSAPGGIETVLVVEDQPEVGGLIQQTLRRAGYTVLAAANGVEAIELARAHNGRIHLLLTDVVLPGSCGRDIARQIVGERGDVRVMYMSGYTDDAVAHLLGVLEPGLAFIQKPFTREALLSRVHAVLAAAQPPPW